MVSASSGYPKLAMVQQSLLDETAAPLIPERPSLTKLREAAAGCQACPLWKTGTQTVFGEGSPKAEVMFVGEQPGDQEDKAGKPFVGPAGRLFDQAMEQAGIDRSLTYVTKRRQALQMAGPREAAHPPEAELVGDHGLRSLARGGACRRQAARSRLPRRDGSAGSPRTPIPGHPAARRARRVGARAGRPRDRASLVDPPRRRGRPRNRTGRLRQRPEGRWVTSLARASTSLLSPGVKERMMGLEPTTFCMAKVPAVSDRG